MRMLRFEEGLIPYIRNQLAGQPIRTSQELYEHAAKIEQVKTELRMTKRWDERGAQAGGYHSKRPTHTKPRPQGPALTGKHYTKCGCTNHNTSEVRVGIKPLLLVPRFKKSNQQVPF